MFKRLNGGVLLAQNDSAAPLISDVKSALDLVASAHFEGADAGLIIMREDISGDFFDLKTGLAGDILQKFVNYRLRVAIVGDFSVYGSKSLRDFIYESNNGKAVNFCATVEDAVSLLTS